MVRLLTWMAFVLLSSSIAVAGGASAGGVVDLNEPGALEELQRSNPAHYAKIAGIMDGLLRQRDADVPRWIQVSFGGRDVRYAPILLTSDPPKRRLSFALDGTRYEAVITLTSVRGEIVPAR